MIETKTWLLCQNLEGIILDEIDLSIDDELELKNELRSLFETYEFPPSFYVNVIDLMFEQSLASYFSVGDFEEAFRLFIEKYLLEIVVNYIKERLND